MKYVLGPNAEASLCWMRSEPYFQERDEYIQCTIELINLSHFVFMVVKVVMRYEGGVDKRGSRSALSLEMTIHGPVTDAVARPTAYSHHEASPMDIDCDESI